MKNLKGMVIGMFRKKERNETGALVVFHKWNRKRVQAEREQICGEFNLIINDE